MSSELDVPASVKKKISTKIVNDVTNENQFPKYLSKHIHLYGSASPSNSTHVKRKRNTKCLKTYLARLVKSFVHTGSLSRNEHIHSVLGFTRWFSFHGGDRSRNA